MAQGFASCVLTLYLLFLLQFNNGSSSREISERDHHSQQKCSNGDHKENDNIQQVVLPGDHAHNDHRPMSQNMDHTVATVGFFTTDDLYVGKRLAVQFAKVDPSSQPPFFPKEKADRIPFSLKELPQILRFFSYSRGSYQAQAIEDTLKHCETEPVEGEKNSCPTSLESMVDFVSSVLGKNINFRALRTTHLGKPSTIYQNYTFLQIREVSSPKMVACHSRPYPYAVYYCHGQGNNKVFEILVDGEDDGGLVNGVAVCHMDTSHWSTDHVSFRFLGVKPGSVPVCHFFARPTDLVWVQNDV